MGDFLNKKLAKWPVFRFFLNSREVLALVVKIIIMVALIPEAVIFAGGFLTSKVISLNDNTVAYRTILIIAAVLFVIGIFLSVLAIVRFVKWKKFLKTRREAEGGTK